LQGYEMMNMLRKGQIRGVEKGDSMKYAICIASLFGVAIYAEKENEISCPSISLIFLAT
jgi:hypothetical protein